jgi:hypothetical protein
MRYDLAVYDTPTLRIIDQNYRRERHDDVAVWQSARLP